MNAATEAVLLHHPADPDPSTLSARVMAGDLIKMSQIRITIKIGFGGGLHEPRYALLIALDQRVTCLTNIRRV